jgi:hypothetical protein
MIGDEKSSDLAIDLIVTISCTRNKSVTVTLGLENQKQSHVEHSYERERFCQIS